MINYMEAILKNLDKMKKNREHNNLAPITFMDLSGKDLEDFLINDINKSKGKEFLKFLNNYLKNCSNNNQLYQKLHQLYLILSKDIITKIKVLNQNSDNIHLKNINPIIKKLVNNKLIDEKKKKEILQELKNSFSNITSDNNTIKNLTKNVLLIQNSIGGSRKSKKKNN